MRRSTLPCGRFRPRVYSARSSILAVSDLHGTDHGDPRADVARQRCGYHWSFFTSINLAARIFSAVFVLQALLLAAAPLVSPSFRLVPTNDVRTAAGLALAADAISQDYGLVAACLVVLAFAAGFAPVSGAVGPTRSCARSR